MIENKEVVVEWILQIRVNTEQYVQKQEKLGVLLETRSAWLCVYNRGQL